MNPINKLSGSVLTLIMHLFTISAKGSIDVQLTHKSQPYVLPATDITEYALGVPSKTTNNDLKSSLKRRAAVEVVPQAPYQPTPNALREFINGEVLKFATKGHPKSKGVAFSIKFPKSWAAAEGERPNIVQKFVSESGSGLEMALILTRSFPPEERVTKEDIRKLLTAQGMRAMLPQGAYLIRTQSTKIEGEPAGLIEYQARMERAGAELQIQTLSLIFFQGTTLVSLQFQMGAIPSEKDDLSKRFNAFRPLFQLIMNSIIFDEKWK